MTVNELIDYLGEFDGDSLVVLTEADQESTEETIVLEYVLRGEGG